MDQVDFESQYIYSSPANNYYSTTDEKLTLLKFLVEEGEKRGYDVNSILEKIGLNNEPCFALYVHHVPIRKYLLLEREINVNYIKPNMRIQELTSPDLAVQMMWQARFTRQVFVNLYKI